MDKRVNSMEIKIGKMEQKFDDLKETNSSEHKRIFKSVDSAIRLIRKFEEDANKRRLLYEEIFCKTEDFKALKMTVEDLKKFKWQFIAVATTALLLLDILGKELILKLVK